MSNLKVLDCTLRDGGYVNNWDFKKSNIVKILSNLVNAGVDYIECGFFKPKDYEDNKSLFSKTEQLEKLIPENSHNTKYTLMINFGEYDIKSIPECKNENIMYRIAFKKAQVRDAIEYCRQLKEKGYGIFINPMHTNTYSISELLELIQHVNEIKPVGFTIVDTTGGMKKKDILTYFYTVDAALNSNIALCFHSHNNLQLSFSNAQCLMEICKNRELIIDSTVFGMGRGAGNLCTELITQYINDNYNGYYDIVPILKIVDEQINPIFAQTPWGYSVPYYLAATNHCHPNYAKYLVDKQTVPVEIINKLLQTIPENKKSGYDHDLIKQIYLDNFSKNIDDNVVVNKFKSILHNRKILVMASGKSISSEVTKIKDFIAKENPYIISLNFVPKEYKSDLTFVTNMKRFSSLEDCNIPLLVTSNIENIPANADILNYSSYLNDSEMYDNVALILFKLFTTMKIPEIYIAGLDGWSKISSENYVSRDMANSTREDESDKRNEIMSKELRKVVKKMKINFITKTFYNVK